MEIEAQAMHVLKPQNLKSTDQALTNYVYVSPNKYK